MSSGGYSGGFGQQPSFGGFGGFGQSPQYGGYGVPQQPQFGGFGGFGGGFGMPQPQYGGFQQPQYGGFDDRFGGGFDRGFGQRGPGNAYARPFPGLQPQPAPQPPQYGTTDHKPPWLQEIMKRQAAQPTANPSTGVMPSEPLPDPNVIRSAVMPPIAEEPQFPVTGGGYPSRDTTVYSQVIPPMMIQPDTGPQPQTGGGYPSRDQFYGQTLQPTMTYDFSTGLSGGLGGMFGGYSPMPYGGYQPMGGYRMFQF